MNQMKCNVKSAIASARANAAVAELLATKRAALDRGRGEWSDDDEEQLQALQHDLAIAMCAVAVDMLIPHLDAYRRPKCPARPPRVERSIKLEPDRTGHVQTICGDAAVAHRLKIISKKQRRTPKDKRVLKLWIDHVKAVQKVEAEGASRVAALLSYLCHAERAGDEDTAATLRGFLAREWAHYGPVPDDIGRAAEELARRRDVLSDELAYGGKPRVERRGGAPQQICAGELM